MDWLSSMYLWEALGVASGLAYVLFAARESIWCWPCALVSTTIFIFLFWDVSLLMESALNLYYLVMAIYGWWHWTRDKPEDKAKLPIQKWSARKHGITNSLIVVLTLISGALLDGRTSAVLPYLDSFTTWAAVITTWMVARKVLENWLYWIVIDAASIVLYLDRALYMTALLFALYVVIAAYGWWEWRQHYQQQEA
jgi:nicotinamide mononucleotide transporter